MSATNDFSTQLCWCCCGITAETPQLITNRPTLSSFAYRVGTHATFNASMLAELSGSDYPALAPLGTRDPSDFSIALLDAWAVALDVLTFYQERLANEAFVRTARDQRSVFEIVRLVGYVPSPGVSASAILTFTLSGAPGSPDNVSIAAGSRVQSIPGPGQTPQIFETSSDLVATIANNALPAQTTIAWQLSGDRTGTRIAGTANVINAGDALLFVAANAGQPVLQGPGDVRYVTAAQIDAQSSTTRISWDTPLSSAFPAGTTADQVCIYVFRKKAALYGVSAPIPALLSGQSFQTLLGFPNPHPAGSDWNFTVGYANGSSKLNLDASYAGLAQAAGGPPQWLILTGLGFTSFFHITGAVDSNPHLFTLTPKTTQLTLEFGKILSGDPYLTLDEVLWLFAKETRDITAYVQSAQLQPASLPKTAWRLDAAYAKTPGMPAPVDGTSLAVTGGQTIAPNQPIGVFGKRVRLQVKPGSGANFVPAHSSSSRSVADNQIFIVEALPDVANAANGPWNVVTLEGQAGSLYVPHRFVLIIAADKADATVSEAAVVQSVTIDGDNAMLTLVQPLARCYDAATVSVNANAVDSTDGQTVNEILGSGDASNPSLEFTLKQSPLTYVSAAIGNGSQSTLQVWANNLQWHEVSDFLTSGASDRVFVTRTGPNGNVVVQFGDGIEGARPPTGQSNVRAVYRKGIGVAGMVAAGQLSQALDRPAGLSSAVNPGDATGGADPATADEARASAALPTLTIGRVVSLEDYQSYALAFAGIAKAIATWTWFGNVRGVFLTVAGVNGATLPPDDPVIVHLVKALRTYGNPYVPLQVASYSPVFFQFAVGVSVDQVNYDPGNVLAAVRQAVSDGFSFERMQLGQSVAASQVVSIVQSVAGVTAMQLQSFTRSGDLSTPVGGTICAAGPLPPQGAELLQLDPVTQSNIGVWP